MTLGKLLLVALLASVLTAAETPEQLAESGHCREALPLLKARLAKVTGAEARKRAAIDGVRCGMTLDDTATALDYLRDLEQHFPKDAAVLYLAVHVFSDLSTRASQKLMVAAPESYQVHELDAEALEVQGKWKEAEEEYREVLKREPGLAGIHYRIGRLLLSNPEAVSRKDDARHELEEELKIDPNNAGAEYVLGELARQDGQDQAAIDHFSRATKLDAGFADAFLSLGRALLASDRAAEAIAPLETVVKLEPDNPMTHFALATAYTRTGRKQDAEREFALQQQANKKLEQTKQDVRQKIAGAPPQAK